MRASDVIRERDEQRVATAVTVAWALGALALATTTLLWRQQRFLDARIGLDFADAALTLCLAWWMGRGKAWAAATLIALALGGAAYALWSRVPLFVPLLNLIAAGVYARGAAAIRRLAPDRPSGS